MRSRIFISFLSVLLLISSLCIIGSSANISVATDNDVQQTPPVETVVCSFQDIAYGEHEKQTFDLNLPVDDREEIGLVVFLHGGGWIAGDKRSSKKSYSIFEANEDYATASINYRLAEENGNDIYDILDDITTALEYIKSMAGGYGMNITKVVFCGHSAGGHLALLYSYKYCKISPITPVGAFVSASVPDLTVEAFYKNNSIGDEEHMCAMVSKASGVKFTPKTRAKYKAVLEELSPINFVTKDSVPTVIVHGKKDKIAPYSGAELLNEVLTENAVMHELIGIENAGHGVIKNIEKKKYAEDLMTACLKEWFKIKPTETTN